jgi:23S rRNA (adenine1618-N6)-methyltransferase
MSDIPVESVDFVMMNPPFYSSEDELLSSAQRKERPPNSACTGAPVEMVCEGGEVAYIGRMMDESLALRDRVQWYTAMVGKASSIEALVERLRKSNINNFAVTEFIQGNKTRRWALGWSFGPMRPAEDVARGIKATPWRNVLPPPSRAVLLTAPSGREVSPLVNRITAVVGALELISWSWDSETAQGVGRASENVWGRAWRRKKLREAKEGVMPVEQATRSEKCQIGFAIRVEAGRKETVASVHWVEGHDQSIFESLCGFLQNKLLDIKENSS